MVRVASRAARHLRRVEMTMPSQAPTAKPTALFFGGKHTREFTETVESERDMNSTCDVVDATNSPAVAAESLHYIQHHTASSRGRTESSESRRVLSTAALLAFAFFAICGGPAGSEDIVLAGGPFIGIIAMLVFPFVFFLPMGFMAVELVTALPVSGGQAYWAALAFGPSWGFQVGYWSWVSNCIDCSMYAAMTIAAIIGPAATIKNTFWEYLIKASFAIGLALPSLWSIRAVGNILLFFTILVLVTYGVVSLWASAEADHWDELLEIRRTNTTPTANNDFVTTGPIDVDWSCLINALVWGYSGFTNLSNLAARVIDPERTYVRVLLMSSVIIPLTYLIPFSTLTAIDKPDWRLWEHGSLGDVAEMFGGEVVASWIMIIDIICSAGLYVGALAVSAFLANGMAQQGIAPPTLGLSTSSGTPHGAIFCSLAVILVVVNLEFLEMLKLTNALGGLEAIVTILAAIRLRFTMADLPRPIKFCGNAHPIVPIVLLVIPLGLFTFVVVDAFCEITSAVLTVAFFVIGLVYTRQANYTQFQERANPTHV